MKSSERNPDQERYRQLRGRSWDQLWREEVPRFDHATPAERLQEVAIIRAVGVVAAESATTAERDEVRAWLRRLLGDPAEKIRRYAMTALPKLGADPADETALLELWRTTTSEREKAHLSQALQKVGGLATLRQLAATPGGVRGPAEQKIKASLARSARPSEVLLDRRLVEFSPLRIHLRCRRGLEKILQAEVEEFISARGPFRLLEVRPGVVALAPTAPFALADLYALRGFDTVGLVLGHVASGGETESIAAWAAAIAAPLTRRVLATFTAGSLRYRLDFVAQGHQRAAVRRLAERAYALCPEILNDAQRAPWTIAIHPDPHGTVVELSPRLTPDPRFAYRRRDVPAASHPPLAACLARLAGRVDRDIVWDPFCGSGSELIERARLGGVRHLYGTDRSAEAIAISEGNFAAANLPAVPAVFATGDFRDHAALVGLGPASATLLITNPPMGKRVPIENLRGLIADLFAVAETVLRPGGRLVLANPLPVRSSHRSLQLEFVQSVDFGGFDCRVELHRKLAR